MGYKSYSDYLGSEHWIGFRQKYYEAEDRFCKVCGTPKLLNIHHVSYKNLGKETEGDVLPLCKPCHKDVHAYLYKSYLDVTHTLEAIKSLKKKRKLRKKITDSAGVVDDPSHNEVKTDFEKDLIRSGLVVHFDPYLFFNATSKEQIPLKVLKDVARKIMKYLVLYQKNEEDIDKRARYRKNVSALIVELSVAYDVDMKVERLLEKIFK